MQDAAGKDINIGDLIIYTVTRGRSPTLKYGIVISLEKGLQMITVDKSWRSGVGRAWDFQNGRNKKTGRVIPVSISGGDRALLINHSQIPQEALELLLQEKALR